MNLPELMLAGLIPTLAIVGLFLYLRRSIPQLVQNVLNDVGAQISETFSTPAVKHAMSIMGKQSGEVRADAALRNRVAEKAVEGSPLLGKALEYFDLSPIEGLQLLNDPLLQPIIQGFLKKGGQSGGSGSLP